MEHSLVSNKCLHLYLPSCADNFNPTPLQATFFIYSKFSFAARARCNTFSRRWPESGVYAWRERDQKGIKGVASLCLA